MKRFLIFAFLGPLLGGIVACVIVVPTVTYMDGHGVRFEIDNIVSGFVIYPATLFFGIIPATIAATADWGLAKTNIRYRWVYVGLLGMIVGFPPFHDNFRMTAMHIWWPLVGGMIGGIPAVLCSLLVRKLSTISKTEVCI